MILSFAVHHWVKMSLDEYAAKIHQMLNKKGHVIFESHNLATLDAHFERKLEIIQEQGFKVVKKNPHERRWK